MRTFRRLLLAVTVAAVISAVGYGVGWQLRDDPTTPTSSTASAQSDRDHHRTQRPHQVNKDWPKGDNDGAKPPEPADPAPSTPEDGTEATDGNDGTDEADRDPSEPDVGDQTPAAMQPGPRLLGPGDDSSEVRELQARLRQIDWFSGDVTDHYGDITETAVRGFQAKRGIPVTGEVDQRTMDRLLAMTSEPSRAELANELASSNGNDPGALDPRCSTGRVLCIDKSSNTLRWVIDGKVRSTFDVRFGASTTPTREGTFSVYRMSRDHVSSIYGSSMPFAMFFDGGQAVHYSSDFAAVGYAGASHGCVNVRDYDGLAALYDQVRLGDKVVVYWS